MIHKGRLAELRNIISREKWDALYIGPSADTEYLAGLSLYPDERVKGLVVGTVGSVHAMTPLLYREEMTAALREDAVCHVWADHEGFEGAFAECLAALSGGGNFRLAFNEGVRAVDLIKMSRVFPFEAADGSGATAPLRRRKDAAELALMKEASRVADAVMEDLAGRLRPGMSEREVKDTLVALFKDRGASELSFPPIVASGEGGSMPHYSGDGRVIREGDFVVVDMGCRHRGYCSDMSRTFHIGPPDEEEKKIYGIVLAAQEAGEAAVRPGATARDVDAAARRVIEDAGYGEYFLNRVGHGVGLAVHEEPYITAANDSPLEPGNVFSVEPGIYLPGRYGVRVENLVAVRDDGYAEPLNRCTKDMMII